MSVSKKQRIWDKSKGHCWYCGISLVWSIFPNEAAHARWEGTRRPDLFVVDHVISKFHGGTSRLENLVPACMRCNCRKRTSSLEEFRRRGGPLMGDIPYFSEEQIAYLRKIGMPLPESFPAPSHVQFWHEQQGLCG